MLALSPAFDAARDDPIAVDLDRPRTNRKRSSSPARHGICTKPGMTEKTSTYKDPAWWTQDHSSAWERAKAALSRDWEQTKADVSDSGRELNQDVTNTVKQAAGKEPIPPANVANPGSWSEAEPGLRYGYGARAYHGGGEWNDKLETDLGRDWEASNGAGTWDRVKATVRRGWEAARRSL